MTQGSLLERTLATNLSWNRARIKFLASFLIALTQTRSVNLVRLAAVSVDALRRHRVTNVFNGFCVTLICL